MSNDKQGCQLPDFSLRSQTFFLYCRLFSYFFIYLETKTFLHIPSQNHPASTLKFKNFDFILQKKFCDFRQKRGKYPHPVGSSCDWTGLWPVVTRTLSTLQSFQTFWNTMLATLMMRWFLLAKNSATKVLIVFNHF